MITCQVHLARHELAHARELLARVARDTGEEVEPRQHLLLTRAWLEIASGHADEAFNAVDAAAAVFDQRSRAGDHAPHLLGRLTRYAWPKHALGRIETWRTALTERSRMTRT